MFREGPAGHGDRIFRFGGRKAEVLFDGGGAGPDKDGPWTQIAIEIRKRMHIYSKDVRREHAGRPGSAQREKACGDGRQGGFAACLGRGGDPSAGSAAPAAGSIEFMSTPIGCRSGRGWL